MSGFLCWSAPKEAEKTHAIALNDDNSWLLVDGLAYPLSTLTAVRLVDGTSATGRIIIWIKAGDSPEVAYRTGIVPQEQAQHLYSRLVGKFHDVQSMNK